MVCLDIRIFCFMEDHCISMHNTQHNCYFVPNSFTRISLLVGRSRQNRSSWVCHRSLVWIHVRAKSCLNDSKQNLPNSNHHFSGNHFNSLEGLIMTSVKNLKKLKKNAGLKLKCKEKNNLGIGLSNNWCHPLFSNHTHVLEYYTFCVIGVALVHFPHIWYKYWKNLDCQ